MQKVEEEVKEKPKIAERVPVPLTNHAKEQEQFSKDDWNSLFNQSNK
jgi:hypothetical protein